MNRWKWLGVFALTVGLLSGARPAQAQTVTFEGSALNGDVQQTHGDFQFTFNASGWAVAPDSFSNEYTRNGTTRLFAIGDRNAQPASVTFKRIDGQPFSLFSLDAATGDVDFTSGRVNVIGNLNSGGTISTTFDVANSYRQYALPSGFTNLESVRVEDAIGGGWGVSAGFGLDNLAYEGTSAVPEPSAALLFLPALAVVGFLKRRRSE